MSINITVISLDFDSDEKPRTLNFDKEIINIGKATENDIVLNSNDVADFHAQIRVENENNLFLTDLATGFGTRLENISIESNTEVPFECNKRISIGSYLIKPIDGKAANKSKGSTIGKKFSTPRSSPSKVIVRDELLKAQIQEPVFKDIENKGTEAKVEDTKQEETAMFKPFVKEPITENSSKPLFKQFSSAKQEDKIVFKQDQNAEKDLFNLNNQLSSEAVTKVNKTVHFDEEVTPEFKINNNNKTEILDKNFLPKIEEPQVGAPNLFKPKNFDATDSILESKTSSKPAGPRISESQLFKPKNFETEETKVDEPTIESMFEAKAQEPKAEEPKMVEPKVSEPVASKPILSEPVVNTPSSFNLKTSPSSKKEHISELSVKTSGDDIADLDFEAVELFELSGSIMNKGKGLAGIELNLGQMGSATTDNNGNFIIDDVEEDSTFDIKIDNEKYKFNIDNQNGIVSKDIRVKIEAIKLFTIKGSVTLDGSGVDNVNIDAGRIGKTTTDMSGNFEFKNIEEDSNYEISAFKDKLAFEKSKISGVLTQDINNLNFIANKLLIISGRVMHKGQPLQGVEINAGELGITTTDSNGYYKFDNAKDGVEYTIKAKKGKFSFGTKKGVRGE